MKEKDQKRLMYELFYGVDGEEDSISYLDMLLRGKGSSKICLGWLETRGERSLEKSLADVRRSFI